MAHTACSICPSTELLYVDLEIATEEASKPLPADHKAGSQVLHNWATVTATFSHWLYNHVEGSKSAAILLVLRHDALSNLAEVAHISQDAYEEDVLPKFTDLSDIHKHFTAAFDFVAEYAGK